MAELPRAVSTDHEFYAHHSEQLVRIADAIDEQNELLRQVLTARQADQRDVTEVSADAGPMAVELREPDPPSKTSTKAAPPEPASTPAPPEPEPAAVDEKKPTRTARGGRRSTKAGN
jgi:hypothetical protein